MPICVCFGNKIYYQNGQKWRQYCDLWLWNFLVISLSFTCQSLLIFESCIIIQNLLNLHLMMLFVHVVHTQWLWTSLGFPLVLQIKAKLYLVHLVTIRSIHYKYVMMLLLMPTLVYNMRMWIFWSYSLGLTLKHNFNMLCDPMPSTFILMWNALLTSVICW